MLPPDDAPLVLVDAENVRRSRWPNLRPDELVARCATWARREGVRAVLVYDGRAPTAEGDIRTVGSGRDSADDWIAREAARLHEKKRRFWLVSSDRELRARILHAERVLGGGAFLAELEKWG